MSNWREGAVCAQVDPEIFFPDQGRSSGYVIARAICARCPVCAECLADDLRTAAPGPRQGMRGGLTPRERDALVRGADAA